MMGVRKKVDLRKFNNSQIKRIVAQLLHETDTEMKKAVDICNEKLEPFGLQIGLEYRVGVLEDEQEEDGKSSNEG